MRKGDGMYMGKPFIDLDLHGCTQEEAMKQIDKALKQADYTTYQIRVVHGFNRGHALMRMIRQEYAFHPQIKRIIPGDNPGVTVLVLKELY